MGCTQLTKDIADNIEQILIQELQTHLQLQLFDLGIHLYQAMSSTYVKQIYEEFTT